MKSELIEMDWLEVRIHTTNEAIEPIINVLTEVGTDGVVIEDSFDLVKEKTSPFGEIYELDPKDFPETGVYIKTYIPDTESRDQTIVLIEERINNLRQYGIDIGENRIIYNHVDEEEWSTAWKKYYKPVQVSERITIKPTWEEYEPTLADELIIELDPGMAFGTGTHGTTKLCLQQLEKYIQPNDHVLDVGCGSGVLSIAALKLGANHVDAYDLDEIAVKSTLENAQLNNIAGSLTVKKNNLLETVNQKADIIVSNILAEVIVLFVKDAWANLREGGLFLTSGIIEKKKQLVLDELKLVGFTIIEEKELDGWISITAQKNGR